MIKKIIILLLVLFNIKNAAASCVELRENSEITVSTASISTGDICITLRDLHPAETYFMADKSYPELNSAALVGYEASWTLSNGNRIYNKNIYTDFNMEKINLQSNDRATLRLKKVQNSANYDYTFNVVNNREIQGFSIISIVVSAQPKVPAPPPTPPIDQGKITNI